MICVSQLCSDLSRLRDKPAPKVTKVAITAPPAHRDVLRWAPDRK